MSIQLLKENRQFNEKEAMNFIQYCKENFVIGSDVAAYLVGFKWDRSSDVPTIVPNIEARNLEKDYLPQLQGLDFFPKIVRKLNQFPANTIEARNKKDYESLWAMAYEIFDKHSLCTSLWREVEITYFMAFNDVIYKEMIKAFANFISTFEEVRKFIFKKAKQDKRIEKFYLDLFEGYDPKTEWFSFLVEDLKVFSSSFESKHRELPEDLLELRTLFWNTHKAKRSDVIATLNKK